ncbi:VPA1269 family protein [Shewanella xiamenensis]|uniref:gamma-mobile-trio integrase GmtZ n=1 Tax=Shewanella xiamenensis TaxID=332186 RepID=UPI00313F33B7
MKNFYNTCAEAQHATQALGIKTQQEYKQRYREDPRLPSNPNATYAAEWQSWPQFLGKEVKNFYNTFAEAQQATQALDITSSEEYLLRYRENPRLPSNPPATYAADWQSWPQFLGKEVKNFYASLAEAQLASRALGITSRRVYLQRYREDPRLPSNPPATYAADWQSWAQFLQTADKFYPTYAEAQQATLALGITSRRVYQPRYREDPRLPSTPDKFYAADWQSWAQFLQTADKFYPTYAEAQLATLALGITTLQEYKRRYREDPRLPYSPDEIYAANWQSWPQFLGKEVKNFYNTFAEAQQATQALGITSRSEYKQRYREDPRLPNHPDATYAADWQSWPQFLGKEVKNFYNTCAEAQQATQALGITTQAEYKQRYREDPRLPSTPDKFYAADWQSWAQFLQTADKFYPTYAEAQLATLALGITSRLVYLQRYREDPRLPSAPDKFYAADWQSWAQFLQTADKFYPTCAEAQQATQALGITTQRDYKRRYREDPRLPYSPDEIYAANWQSWPQFLGKEVKNFYNTCAEAQHATQALGITTQSEYQQRYREDPRLPSSPDKIYAADWQSWTAFLLPNRIDTLRALKIACKVLGIRDSLQYRQIQKEYSQLPSKPDKKFKDWIDWYDLLEIPKPYELHELKKIVRSHKCTSIADYKKLRSTLNDPKMPASPIDYYKDKGWTNTFDFFGVKRPYQVRYFEPEWKPWGDLITEFLKTAKGGDTKVKDLCEFVREYIEPNKFEISPLDYLTRGKTNIQPMLELFELVPITRKKKWLFSINEFLDWLIVKFLTIEDEDTGEVSRIKGAKNPFSHINFDDEQIPVSLNETNKLALPYQFVKSAREWIFPQTQFEKISYSELLHLHKFQADWVPIDESIEIDPSDPDCVTKVEGGKTYLWLPIYWTYTYALMQLPARGRQIVYCDSGEADAEVPNFQTGKITWSPNRSKLAGLTTRQSMINKTRDGDFGVYYTSNKTSFDGKGYAIPFMPIELAYWLIKLRKWQEKYNPIEKPTEWLECTRTNLNELQRKQKGRNCFLFRDFKEIEPGTFGGRLASRLAAALFFSSDDQLVSASYEGQNHQECASKLKQQQSIALKPFKSAYTPHAMRVSLINAYAYEFGMPMEVIMKLVGHSSIIMSIYYIKSDKTGANIREKVTLGEKNALNKATETLKSFIESQRIEECKSQLVANNAEFLSTIDNTRPASSYLFRDFGICPVGGGFCNEGGAAVAMKANIYHPVTAGYLGEQNCIQCRFFITGIGFMMGLVALFNEISLAVHTQSLRYSLLGNELNDTANKIDILSHKIYEHKLQNSQTSNLEIEKLKLQSERRKLNSEIEVKAKKMDLYSSDMNAINKHLFDCQSIINQHLSTEDPKLQLIVPKNFSVNCRIDEVSGFQQLSEVCENAELYHSCTDEQAVIRRSQSLDKMLMKNGIGPQLLHLNETEQLIVGNQMTQLMLTRLKSWEKIDRLIDGDLVLNDFDDSERISKNELKQLFMGATPLKLVD